MRAVAKMVRNNTTDAAAYVLQDAPVNVVDTAVPAQLWVGAIGSAWLKRPEYCTAGWFGFTLVPSEFPSITNEIMGDQCLQLLALRLPLLGNPSTPGPHLSSGDRAWRKELTG